MKIDIYHLYKHFDYTNYIRPIILDVLKIWSLSVGWDVRVFVCREKDVDLQSDADVVAFSVYTQTAPACYRLSKKYRQKEKIVIFGGPHFRNSNYKEGGEHCDVLVKSINERQWKMLLHEISEGLLQTNDKHKIRFIVDHQNLFRYPKNFYESFNSQAWWQITSVPTSLGCPYKCFFCSPHMPGKYILREVSTVRKELENAPRFKPVFIADASFALNKVHTIEMMKAIAPLKRNILIESTLQRLQDTELLDALAVGGVKWISIGIESLHAKLTKLGKGKIEDNIKRFLDKAHERGILVQGNIICGLDADGPESFDEIYDFYVKSDLDLIIVDILTPYPTSKLFWKMKRSDRIIDTNWEHYDYRHVVYQPKQMSVNQLIKGYNQLYKALFSPKSVLKKIDHLYSSNGITYPAICVALYNLWSGLDAWRKEKALIRSRNEIGVPEKVSFKRISPRRSSIRFTA